MSLFGVTVGVIVWRRRNHFDCSLAIAGSSHCEQGHAWPAQAIGKMLMPCRAGHTDSRQAPVPPRHALMDLIVPTAASGAGALQVFLLSSSNEA